MLVIAAVCGEQWKEKGKPEQLFPTKVLVDFPTSEYRFPVTVETKKASRHDHKVAATDSLEVDVLSSPEWSSYRVGKLRLAAAGLCFGMALLLAGRMALGPT
jgi:hypothetical protein